MLRLLVVSLMVFCGSFQAKADAESDATLARIAYQSAHFAATVAYTEALEANDLFSSANRSTLNAQINAIERMQGAGWSQEDIECALAEGDSHVSADVANEAYAAYGAGIDSYTMEQDKNTEALAKYNGQFYTSAKLTWLLAASICEDAKNSFILAKTKFTEATAELQLAIDCYNSILP